MFKRSESSEKITTIIGQGTKLEGMLEATGIIRVDGFVQGKIVTPGNVIVGEEGRVNAEIEAGNLIIMGEITGNVVIRNTLELKKGGFLRGDICSAKVIVEEDSFFDGKCLMTDPGNPSKKREKKERVKDKDLS